MDYVKDIVGNKVHVGDEVIYTEYKGVFERAEVIKIHPHSVSIKRLKQTEDIQSIQNYKRAISLWNKIHDCGPRSSKSVRKIMYKGFLNF